MATLAEVLRQAGYVTPQGQVVGPRTDLAQKLKSYVMNIPQNAAQNLANQRADIDAALTMGQGGIQIGDRAAFERQMAEVPNLMGLTAYHGTPHTIKGKFDISKVGTGEGAQAYGHGMYFAESPEVAKNYANTLAMPDYSKTALGEALNPQLSEMLVTQFNKTSGRVGRSQTGYPEVIDAVNNELNSKLKIAQKANNQEEYAKLVDLQNQLHKFEESPSAPLGNLYKVDIPDEYIPKMIDFEKPLKDQPKDIQDWVIQKDPEAAKAMFTGATLRKFLTSPDTSKQSAEELLAMGYKGIRYLDEGRHNAVTSNFVVFDPSDVKILEKNSKPMTRKEIIEQELEKVAK